jgi:hypothetical protein
LDLSWIVEIRTRREREKPTGQNRAECGSPPLLAARTSLAHMNQDLRATMEQTENTERKRKAR